MAVVGVGVRGVDIFTRNVGKARNGGIGFIMEGWEIFLSLFI